jgi:putative flavoprotein involved in K+ transport
MADYLEAYAARFKLPVRTGIKVDGLSRQGSHYLVTAGDRRFRAEHVIIAMALFRHCQVNWLRPERFSVIAE